MSTPVGESTSGSEVATADTGLAKVARGSALNLVGAAVSALAGFALVVVITRGSSRADAGVFFTVTSVFLIAGYIGQLGTDLGMVYFLSRARALGRHALIGRYLRTALEPVLAVAVAMSVAMFVLAPELARLTNADHAAQATTYLRILALFVAPSCIAAVLLAATRGMGTMRANVLIEQVGRQILQVALVAIAAALPTKTAIGWAWGLPYIGSLVAVCLWWRSIMRRTPAFDGDVEPVGRAFWRFTAPRTITTVAQQLIQRIDIVLVGALAGATQAAVFTASTRFVVAGQMGSFAVTLAVQPHLAAALARHDHAGAKHLFQTASAWLVGITFPLYLTFCVSGRTLQHVFGAGYGGGASILLLVTLGMLVGAACGDVDSALVMSGRTTWSLANTLFGLAVMVGLDVWLIPIHGAVGAGIGWGVAIMAKNLAGLVQVWLILRIHPFASATLTMIGLNLACFLAIQAAVRALPLPEFLSLVAGFMTAGIAYLAGLWLLRKPLLLDEFRSLRRRRG
jgi:O-antigen/teichoic acid export membrane protein